MTYRTSQPYNNCSNGTKPYFSGCKQLFIPDRYEHYHNPYSYHNCDPLLSYYNQHHSECNPFYKHNCVPYQADCRPYYHHGHDPYYGNNHGHDTASWYHAHDSGNTVVLNVPPYWTVGTRTGIGTGIGTETTKQGSAQDLGYGSTTGNDLF